MKELSKRDWLFVALAAFVMSGTAFVVFYCSTGWAGDVGASLRFDPDHKSLAAPKLNVVVAHHALGLLDCLGIVAASERFKSNEMPVLAHRVRAVPRPCAVLERFKVTLSGSDASITAACA